MLEPSIAKLTEQVGTRYLLVNVVARRAREIAERADREEIQLAEKPIRTAIYEVAEGTLQVEQR